MKKLILIPFLAAIILANTSCFKEIQDEAANLGTDLSKSYDNLKRETEGVIKTIEDAKNKINKTADDISKAKDAVEDIFK